MNKVNIGIITIYYKNQNYGGNLQAWALCRYLKNEGYETEQINYISKLTALGESAENVVVSSGAGKIAQKISTLLRIIKKEGLIKGVKSIIRILQQQIDVRKTSFYDVRRKAIEGFNSNVIPNSNNIYDDSNINECLQDYDVFITGSDQVWNMTWYVPAYFLEFVPSNKTKMSYAASMAMDELDEEQKNFITNALEDYTAISVRESKTVDLLKEISPVEPVLVVDPVLLLERNAWDEICAERVVSEKYLFCYFLGRNKKERLLAKKFAKKKRLKLIHIPFTAGVDCNFGDKRLIDVTPEQFISLIKYAEYVFTDSFHATAFSHIYQKQYFIFNRSEKGEMSSRITDITDLFETTERFCVGKERENYKYICSLPPIDYNRRCEKFEKRKKGSIEFLQKNLQG